MEAEEAAAVGVQAMGAGEAVDEETPRMELGGGHGPSGDQRSASARFAHEMYHLVDHQQIDKSIQLQHDIYKKLVESNRALATFNDFSHKQFAAIAPDIERKTRMLKEMRKDLEIALRRIANLKQLLAKNYPSQYAVANEVVEKHVLEEDEDVEARQAQTCSAPELTTRAGADTPTTAPAPAPVPATEEVTADTAADNAPEAEEPAKVEEKDVEEEEAPAGDETAKEGAGEGEEQEESGGDAQARDEEQPLVETEAASDSPSVKEEKAAEKAQEKPKEGAGEEERAECAEEEAAE